MLADHLNLRVIYGYSDRLEIIGQAAIDGNRLVLDFDADALARLATGELKAFVLVAAFLEQWPTLPEGLASRPLETHVFANPRGVRKDNRPQVWEGWPITEELVLLRPCFAAKFLDRLETRQDGFVLRLRDAEGAIVPPAPRYEATEAHGEPAEALEAPVEVETCQGAAPMAIESDLYEPGDLLAAEPFCGAGGMALGLDRAGFAHVWAGEKDKHASATFASAYPDTALVEGMLDGTEDLGIPVGRLDLLAGGPPCQPFSSAGDRKGQWDSRDGFPIFLRLVERYRPRAVLMENVAGLLTARHASYVEAIQDALGALGYSVELRLLQAADFGVPQRRARVFFVAFREEADAVRFRWPTPTHSLEALVERKYRHEGHDPDTATRYETTVLRLLEAHHATPPTPGTKVGRKWAKAQSALKLLPWVTVREVLADLVSEFSPGKTLHSAPNPAPLASELVDAGRGGALGEKGTSRSKSLLYKRTLPDVPADTVSAAAEQKGSEHCARVALVVRNLGAGDGIGARLDDVAPTVTARVAGQSGLAAMDASTAHHWTSSEGTTEAGRVHTRPSVVLRRLSHVEVGRLQSFPDDWPWRGPSTAIYRQIGNAVPPPLAEAMGKAIASALRPKKPRPLPTPDDCGSRPTRVRAQ